ncbi:unnamed protein product [Brassica oleracea]
MNVPLLDIQPRTLKFVVDLKKQSTCVVQLTNTTNLFVAFKVKTTSPKKYCVRPNVGVVAPKSSCEFSVIMQAFKEPPPDMVCKDKFLIQSTAVPEETTDEDITASMFSKAEGKHIEENKLRVTLVLPSDSPELSPVKGTLNQEAVFEDSILKDRVYGQSETLRPPQYESEIVKEPRMVGHDELKAPYDAKEANDLKATKGGYATSNLEKEAEFDPIKSHKDADDGRGIKSTHNLDTPTKMAMDLDQVFPNGKTSANSVTYSDEPKIPRNRDVVHMQQTDAQNIKALEESKLVKDIEGMKLKVNALESKLKQADSTISKLMEERSISFQHRESLQQELAELRTKKIVKEVHIGFPLLYVCVVAFISIVIGWASIASYLPQRTDNNYWNTHLKKNLNKSESEERSISENMALQTSATRNTINHRSTTYASSTENISRLLEGSMRASPKSSTANFLEEKMQKGTTNLIDDHENQFPCEHVQGSWEEDQSKQSMGMMIMDSLFIQRSQRKTLAAIMMSKKMVMVLMMIIKMLLHH